MVQAPLTRNPVWNMVQYAPDYWFPVEQQSPSYAVSNYNYWAPMGTDDRLQPVLDRLKLLMDTIAWETTNSGFAMSEATVTGKITLPDREGMSTEAIRVALLSTFNEICGILESSPVSLIGHPSLYMCTAPAESGAPVEASVIIKLAL